MKKWVVVFALMMLCSVNACGGTGEETVLTSGNQETASEELSESAVYENQTGGNEEDMTMETGNRTLVAETLGVDEDNRSLRFILNTLDTIGAGRIQSAETTEMDGQHVMNFVAEDGTNYQMLLSKSGIVEAVQNLDTGEWPIKSEQ